MEQNMLKNSQDSVLECPYCKDKIDDFKIHINGDSENEENSSCGNCDLILKNEQCLTSHVKIAHLNAMKVFSCEICNIDFDSKNHLFIHKDLVHNGQDIKKEVDYINEVMDKTNQEITGENNEITKNQKCDECDKVFTKPSLLSSHKASAHIEIRRYKCYECKSEFKEKWNLNRHIDQKIQM